MAAVLDNLFVLDVEATSPSPMTGVMTEFGIVHVASGNSFYGHLYAAHPHPDIPALPVAEADADGHPVIDAYAVINGSDTARARDLVLASGDDVVLDETIARWLPEHLRHGFGFERVALFDIGLDGGVDACVKAMEPHRPPESKATP